MPNTEIEYYKEKTDDASLQISYHFGKGRDLEFGRRVLLRLADNTPLSNDRGTLADEITRLYDFSDRELNGTLRWEIRQLAASIFWRIDWILEHIKSYEPVDTDYSIEQIVKMVLDDGYVDKAVEAADMCNDIKLISNAIYGNSSRPTTQATWIWKLDEELLEDICRLFKVESFESVIEAFHYAFSNEVGRYIRHCDREALLRIKDLHALMLNYYLKASTAEKIRDVITGFTGKEYDGIISAVDGYLEMDRQRRPDAQMRAKVAETFVKLGLYDDYKAYLDGVPLEDIMI